MLAGRWMLSYMFPVTLGLVFAAAPMVSRSRLDAQASAVARLLLALAYAAVVALNCGHLSRIDELTRYADGATEWVRRLDREAARLGLRCGVTDYWLAKPVTLFSATGLRMIQSTPDMMPLDWISNRKWYDRFEPRFICCTTNANLSDRIRERDVVAKFGVPTARHTIDDMVLLVYPPADGLSDPQPGTEPGAHLYDWWRNHPMRVRFDRTGDRATYNVSLLTGRRKVSLSAPRNPAGSFAFGLRRTLPRGDYAVRVAYEAISDTECASPGSWMAARVAKDTAQPLGDGMLRFGTNMVGGVFSVGWDSHIDLRIIYSGYGTLTPHKLELERLR
jgi:hypothetical protein